MTRPWRRSFTGTRRGAIAAIAAPFLVLLAAPPSPAQVLRVRSLDLPAGISVGGWASFRVSVQSRSHPPREYVQRVAVVAREGIGSEAGVWVEVKTVEPSGTVRIERGYFTPPQKGEEPRSLESGGLALEIRRYQVWTPEGKLYEFDLESDTAERLGSEGSALSLFEFDTRMPPAREAVGLDTLRWEGRAIPASVEKLRWIGSEEWADPTDSLASFHAVATQTLWRTPQVPVGGYARSLFEVRTARFGPRDSTGALTPLPREGSEDPPPMLRAEMSLLDYGDDAVPEVTQEPEPPPAEAGRPERRGIPSR